MADASLSQHVDTGLGAVTNCRADIYGPEVIVDCYVFCAWFSVMY